MVLDDFVFSLYEDIQSYMMKIHFHHNCRSVIENKRCNSRLVTTQEKTKEVTTLGDPLGVKNFPIFPVLKISFIKNNIIIDYFIENDFLGVSG